MSATNGNRPTNALNLYKALSGRVTTGPGRPATAPAVAAEHRVAQGGDQGRSGGAQYVLPDSVRLSQGMLVARSTVRTVQPLPLQLILASTSRAPPQRTKRGVQSRRTCTEQCRLLICRPRQSQISPAHASGRLNPNPNPNPVRDWLCQPSCPATNTTMQATKTSIQPNHSLQWHRCLQTSQPS